ncbi:hypothetical protein BDW74DRAFT_185952 [Aspergillus multicolor]|uniref:uncharacterized protein n=1 Tax=Aspergillus multicolor TaxID=41759 RepID=UPI003CCC9713
MPCTEQHGLLEDIAPLDWTQLAWLGGVAGKAVPPNGLTSRLPRNQAFVSKANLQSVTKPFRFPSRSKPIRVIFRIPNQSSVPRSALFHTLNSRACELEASTSSETSTCRSLQIMHETLLDGGLKVPEDTDTASIYSDVSAVFENQMGYIDEMADELFNVALPYHHVDGVMQNILDTLPGLLKSMALSIGHGSSTPMHREIMVFLHKYRRDIATAFRERLVRNNSDEEHKRAGNTMSLDEIIGRWQQKDEVSCNLPLEVPRLRDDCYQGDDKDTVPPHTAEQEKESTTPACEVSRLESYRCLVHGDPTYGWLLSKIRNECTLFTPGHNVAKEIRSVILKILPVTPKVSRQSGTETLTARFKVDWDAHSFLLEQGYEESPEKAIQQSLTFTGVGRHVQADSCSEYMRRTWPTTGGAMAQLLQYLVSGENGGIVVLADGTWVRISRIGGVETYIGVYGTAALIAEVGEQVAWISSALRSAQNKNMPMSHKPFVRLITLKPIPRGWLDSLRYEFEIGTEQHEMGPIAGSCWQGLVVCPAVVEGFPIQRRPANCPPGLEMPIGIMASLLGTRKVHWFDNRAVLKGFSTLLIPTRVINDITSWHLIHCCEDERISYLQSLAFPRLVTPKNCLETARHVLGWCSEVKFYAGSQDANYKVNDSRLARRSGLKILKDVSLSSDYSITGGSACSLGRKDVRLRRNGYVNKMKWISGKYTMLWDTSDERGWLLNGASSLLHLASHTHHPDSALEVLLNIKNLNLRIYNVDAEVTFKTRVEDLYDQMEKMYDYQIAGLRNNPYSPRSLLEGWDFEDLILERDPTYPRHTILDPGGLPWVDFTRSINAITIFGRGFGEIMRPVNACEKGHTLESKKSYLAASISDMKKIMSAKGDPYDLPMRLTHDIVWHIDEASFPPCPCQTRQQEGHTMVVQTLLPSTLSGELPRSPPRILHSNGAVILGFNESRKWYWRDTGRPSRTQMEPVNNTSYQTVNGTDSEDSGLGNSLGSSSSMTTDGWTSSIIQNDDIESDGQPTVNPKSQQLEPWCTYPSTHHYKVGIVCALHRELLAVRVLFDKRHPNVKKIADEDPNHYVYGRMGEHNIIAVCLPHGVYGTNAAADVVSNMRRSFPSLQYCLLVGVGAGVPSIRNDIRLGDVVVSTPSGRYSGVLPYDMIKSLEAGASQLNGYLCPPPQILMCAISELESDPARSSAPLADFLKQIQTCKPEYGHPGVDKDQLFVPSYTHVDEQNACEKCDTSQLVPREPRFSLQPKIFYGLIASGNRLMRSAHERVKLGNEHNVLCFEMEGAGIMNSFPCLIIRGICDYADSHKNKAWQNYASAAAAAYAKLLLLYVRATDDPERASSIVYNDRPGPSRKRARSPGVEDTGPLGERRRSVWRP